MLVLSPPIVFYPGIDLPPPVGLSMTIGEENAGSVIVSGGRPELCSGAQDLGMAENPPAVLLGVSLDTSVIKLMRFILHNSICNSICTM